MVVKQRSERVADAVAARSVSNNIADGLGPALAAAVLAIGTPADVLLFDAAFLLTATVLVSLPVYAHSRRSPGRS